MAISEGGGFTTRSIAPCFGRRIRRRPATVTYSSLLWAKNSPKPVHAVLLWTKISPKAVHAVLLWTKNPRRAQNARLPLGTPIYIRDRHHSRM